MASTQTIGNLIVRLLFDDKDLDSGTKRSKSKLSAFANEIGNIANQVDRQITTAFSAAAAAMTALGTAAVLTGAQFEKRMDEVAAVSGATKEELAQLTETAREIGKTTAFSASQAADGMINLARAGFKTSEIIEATRASLVLAGAGNIDLAKATDLVASTIRQFSLDASDSAKVADVFTAATQNSQFSLDDLAKSMSYAGTVGSALGLSLEETTAGVAQFIDLGLEASTAGTVFRQAMLSLTNPSKTAREALKSLGLELKDVSPEAVGFGGAMKALGDAGLDAGRAMDIFGTEAGANVAKVAANFAKGEDTFTSLLDTLINAAGTAEQTYRDMLDNVLGDTAILKSTIEELFLKIFDSLSGPLRRLLSELTLRVSVIQDAFSDLGEEAGTTFDRIVDLILEVVDAAIGLLPHLQNIAIAMFAALVASKGVTYTVAVAKLAQALGVNVLGAVRTLTAALGSLSLAGGFLLGAGVAVTVAGIGLVVAAITDLISELTGAKDAAVKLEAALKSAQMVRDQETDQAAGLEDRLNTIKDEIRKRQELGEQISAEERAILKLTAAQLQQKIQAGEILDIYGNLVPASKAMSGQFGAAMMDTVRDAKRLTGLTEQAKKLLADYADVGVGPASAITERLFNAQLFDRASRKLGITITSYQDLATAVEFFEKSASKANAKLDALKNASSDQAAAAAAAAAATDEWSDKTVTGAKSAEELQKALDKKRREQEKEDQELLRTAMFTLQVAKERDAEREAVEKQRREYQLFQGEMDLLAASLEATGAKVVEFLQDLQAKFEAEDRVMMAVMSTVEKLGKQFLVSLGDLAVEGLNLARSAALDLFNSIKSLLSPLFDFFELFDAGKSIIEDIKALDEEVVESSDRVTEAQERLAEAEEHLAEVRKEAAKAREDGLTPEEEEANARALAEAQEQVAEATQAIADAERAVSEAKGNATDARFDAGVEGLDLNSQAAQNQAAAAAAGNTADEISSFLTSIAKAMPYIIEALIAELPSVIGAIIRQIPRILDAVIEGLPDIVAVLAEEAPKLIDRIMQRIPDLLIAIGEGLISIIGTLPELISSVLTNADEIITTLVEVVVDVVAAFVEQLPNIISAIIDAIPDIIVAVVEALPVLLEAVIAMAPQIMLAVIGMLPQLLFAILELIPRVLVAMAEGMINVAGAFWDSIVDFFTEGIPDLAKSFWDQLVSFITETIPDLAKDLGQRIADFFLEIVTIGLHKSKRQKEYDRQTAAGLEQDVANFLAQAEEDGLNVARAQSGIEYVPRTMATILEPGEGVLDAMSNARRLEGGAENFYSPPAPGVGMSGPGWTGGQAGRSVFEFIVQMDTAVVDAQLIDGVEEGRAPRTRQALRAASGTRTGFRRGRLQPWGR